VDSRTRTATGRGELRDRVPELARPPARGGDRHKHRAGPPLALLRSLWPRTAEPGLLPDF